MKRRKNLAFTKKFVRRADKNFSLEEIQRTGDENKIKSLKVEKIVF